MGLTAPPIGNLVQTPCSSTACMTKPAAVEDVPIRGACVDVPEATADSASMAARLKKGRPAVSRNVLAWPPTLPLSSQPPAAAEPGGPRRWWSSWICLRRWGLCRHRRHGRRWDRRCCSGREQRRHMVRYLLRRWHVRRRDHRHDRHKLHERRPVLHVDLRR